MTIYITYRDDDENDDFDYIYIDDQDVFVHMLKKQTCHRRVGHEPPLW